MARGQEEKLIIINKIKEVFPEAFEYDKTIRIPIGDVQIKVALTAAKDNVEPGGDAAVPGVKATKVTIADTASAIRLSGMFSSSATVSSTDNACLMDGTPDGQVV